MSSTPLAGLSAVAVGLASTLAFAQPFLVRNINTAASNGGSGGVGGFGGTATASIGNQFFFVASDPSHGSELWVSDGSEQGTHIVKDIWPGIVGGAQNAAMILAVGDRLYFSANDGIHGFEAWTSDGTEEGTHLLIDLYPGISSSDPQQFISANGWIYFSAFSPVVGREFFRSDGTPGGTTLVRDIRPGPQGGVMQYPPPVEAGGKIYFVGDTAETGSELWVIDGSPEGAVLVRDLVPGVFGPSIDSMAALNGRVYFDAYTGQQGAQLWTSDGTSAGTVMLPIPGAGHSPREFAAGATRMYFNASDSTNAGELCRTDGTPGGTLRVRSIESCTVYANDRPHTLGDTCFFAGLSQEINGTGCEPWVTDGTVGGTHVLRDIALGQASSSPTDFHEVPDLGLVFFIAWTGNQGPQLWRTDGTTQNTFVLTGFTSTTALIFPSLHHAGNKLFFRADDGTHGQELWVSDGTIAGTHLVRDVYPAVPEGASSPSGFIRAGNDIYFQAYQAFIGVELWATEARPGRGARIVTDININGSSNSLAWSTPGRAAALGDILLFNATDGSGSPELWRANGRFNGTMYVRPQAPGPRLQPGDMTPLDDSVIFTAIPAVGTATEVWRTDGTSEGTVRIRDGCCFDDCAASPPVGFVRLGNRVLFAACDSDSGRELWATGGAPDGSDTAQVADINPGEASSDPGEPGVLAGRAVFAATDDSHGRELWATDGTGAGTHLVRDIATGTASSSPTFVRATPTRAFFFADPGDATGRELWVSDGTSDGTHMVRDIVPGEGSPSVHAAVTSGEKLYFIADDHSGAGTEVWVSDGTEDGTHIIVDLIPGNTGPDDPAPRMLTAAPEGRAVFSAPGDDAGAELWETDGMPTGTRRLSDINPGPGSSDPESAYLSGRTLVFSAFDAARNRELWAYRFPGAPCPADWDLSGGVDSQDFFEFLNDFFNGAADFNANLVTDSSDVFDFLTSFFAGC